MLTLKVDFSGGTHLRKAIAESQEFLRSLPQPIAVEFEFNGVTVRVFPQSDPEEVLRQYHEDRRRPEPARGKWWWPWRSS